MSIDSVYTLPLIAGFCVVASLLLPWCGAWVADNASFYGGRLHTPPRHKNHGQLTNWLWIVFGWTLIVVGAFAAAVPFVLGIVKQGDGYVVGLGTYAVALGISWCYLIMNYTDIEFH